jgi:hypothetical protein
MKNTVQVLVHLLAFGSNTLFAFTGEDKLRQGVGLSDLAETDLLEFVFRQCNHVDGSEWIEGRPLRSLSVGDVVIVIRKGSEVSRYRCDGCGWSRFSEGEQDFRPLQSLPAADRYPGR